MTEGQTPIQQVLERLASDPDFRKRFIRDPARTVREMGCDISPEDLKVLVDEASEGGEELDKRVMM